MATKIMADEIVILPPEVESKVEKEIMVIRTEANVTEELIKKLKDQYGGLTIRDHKDKEGYLNLQVGRKLIKKVRVEAEKLFDKGRAEAVLVADKWLENKKIVIAELKEIEEPLLKLEKDFEEVNERLKAEERQRVELQGIERIGHMTKFGATLIGNMWVLGDVQYEATLVKEIDSAVYKTVYDEYEAQYNINEAARIEADAQRERDRQELEAGREAIRKQQEELAAQKRQIRDGIAATRKAQLFALGFELDNRAGHFSAYGVFQSFSDFERLLDSPQGDWDARVDELEKLVDDAKEDARIKKEQTDADAEKKRQTDLEAAHLNAVGQTRASMLATVNAVLNHTSEAIGGLTEDEWTTIYNEAKDKNDKNVAKKAADKAAEEAAKLSDKEKWNEFQATIKLIITPTMRSGQYRERVRLANELINKIKLL